MRKMTKTAVTLAAMSAMTIASASLAFAAAQRDQLNAVENPAATSNPNSGKWEGSDANGWTFTPADENKLKNTWAEIDGIWYYFHKDGIMAQDELVYLEGETYYFTPTGAMAVGWYEFDNDNDVLYDYGLDIQENIDDIHNKVFRNAEDAYDTIWMYFNTDGKAKDDEWYQAENSGLWYRFDDIVMVCGDYDHEVNGSYYGFGEDGHMFVGWEQNYTDNGITAPNTDSKSWYWYDSNGKKFDVKAENNNTAFGWKKIDGKWYCFKTTSGINNKDTSKSDPQKESVGTLITKTLFMNDKTAGENADYYYVDNNGVMATGIITVDKGAKLVNDTYGWEDDGKVSKLVDSNWEVFFDTGNGKAKKNTWSSDKFYASIDSGEVMAFDKDTFAVTEYKYLTKDDDFENAAAKIQGALVKNSFVTHDSETYYVDKYGDKVKSSAIQIGYINASKDSKGNYSFSDYLYDDEDIAEDYLTAGQIVCKAYIVVNAKGIAYDDIDANRTINAGAKKYVATGLLHPDVPHAEIFYYYNKN